MARSVRTLICPSAAAGTGARGLLRSAGACPPRSLSVRVFLRRHCEGQALALREPVRAFFRSMRGTGPRATGTRARIFSEHARDRPSRSLPHPGHPDNPGHPASDVRAIKVLTDLYSLLRRRSIDMKVLTDLNLSIGGCGAGEGQALALRAPGRAFFRSMRGTGPRATGTEARFFFVGRRTGPRSRSLILAILIILAILLQT